MSKDVIAVDLDGTLIYADLTWELLLGSFFRNPFKVILILFKTFGRLNLFKEELIKEFGLSTDCKSLPYNQEVIDYIKNKKRQGYSIILATASHQKQADQIAKHLGFFDEVFASDKDVNLKAEQKANLLVKRFGFQKYTYLGNSKDDLSVWRTAKKAICVNCSRSLFEETEAPEKEHFSEKRGGAKSSIRLLRVYQWVKNSLLFLPLLASHQIFHASLFINNFIGFLSFSFMASSLYIVNDLLDLPHDRAHVRKKSRPLASGAVQVPQALVLFLITFLTSVLLALSLGRYSFLGVLFLYALTSFTYSMALKKQPIVDVLVLASLFVVRIFAGEVLSEVELTHWFLLFFGFSFFSLALVKRYAEFKNTQKMALSGRGYQQDDYPLISNLGISSALVSLVVFGLYLNSEHVLTLYKNPQYLWFVVPILTYAFSYIWLCAGRGQLDDDPILFLFKKRRMYVLGAFIFLFLLKAKF